MVNYSSTKGWYSYMNHPYWVVAAKVHLIFSRRIQASSGYILCSLAPGFQPCVHYQESGCFKQWQHKYKEGCRKCPRTKQCLTSHTPFIFK